jgi:hypothetical protein
MQLRNPGRYSFLIFLAACALVAFLHWRGAEESTKLAGQLVALVVASFGARSALATTPRNTRKKQDTWPGLPDERDP